jgi:hypothetical protein
MLKAASIIALGLVLGGIAKGGVYESFQLDNMAVCRVNRFTGSYVILSPFGHNGQENPSVLVLPPVFRPQVFRLNPARASQKPRTARGAHKQLRHGRCTATPVPATGEAADARATS